MTIGAILPLSVRGSYDVDDLGRTEILFKTLDAFCEPGLFSKFLIVTPPDEVQIVTEKVRRWAQFNPVVMSEEDLVPELGKHQHMRGWRKQQIVKIAAHTQFTDEFYITFDADVICLKPLSIEKLIVQGKALLQYEPRSFHPKWWKSSARLLKMSPEVGDTSKGMHVTPAILSTKLAKQLTEELTTLWKKDWVKALCSLHNPKHPGNWRISRFLMLKWTEYSLYYLCSMKNKNLDKFHITAGSQTHPQLLLIHDSHPYEDWDTAKSFSSDCPGLFCVVGSKSRLEPEEVWQRISPFVPVKS
ncbi:DUF6492 family protein [Aliiglaciecola sp. 2_MG-2023]|uniref:DUF6492 family protein n=1 Tax=Alteromonadaceae TaxID=72275 RepID=UPI0026E28E5F|nr:MULTISPECIES: DUF6492 family protein [unclassified Aliiglaciecola]MDO6711142.1 DUF6492 family protein [Aliiglaciecola sp. 2_MG-2023]MDO6752056.1 DUF6492 family protein [Aliiglaciecola sp. 1_MG-2023]